jgi:plastocyanin
MTSSWIRGGALLACLAFFASGAADAAQTVEVGVDHYKFQPERLKVKVGTTVKWINQEKRTSHSVWFRSGGEPESERLFPGESWQRTFTKPGVYPYTCGPHPEMHGVIEVVP